MRLAQRLVALGSLLGLLAPSRAAAFCQSHTQDQNFTMPTTCPNQGFPLHWAGRCVSLSLDPAVLPAGIPLPQVEQELRSAAARWTNVQCGGGSPSFSWYVLSNCSADAGYNPRGPNSNRVAFLSTWGVDAFHEPDAIAITVTTFDTSNGELRDADTDINLRTATNPNGFTFTLGVPGSTEVDLPTVLTHELGHSLGLGHSTVRSAVMWYAAGLGEQRRELTQDDSDGLCAVYPPGRSATCDPTPPHGFQCATGCRCSTPGLPSRGRGSSASPLALLIALRFARSRRPRRGA